MINKTPTKGLGKGFKSLFPQINKDLEEGNIIQEIEINSIIANSEQPRKYFSLPEIEGLSQSIKNKGVIQPIILRTKNSVTYEIIAGERRWRAAKIAGLKKIKAIVHSIPDSEVREIALIENIQRKDLNPIEEAIAYQSLLEEKKLTHDDLAKKVGKNRATITNLLRLLTLPKTIIDSIINEKITTGHAKCLLSLDNEKEQKKFNNLIIEKKLSVHGLEKELKKNNNNKDRISTKKDLFKEQQEIITNVLQTNTKIIKSNKVGEIIIQFYNKEDLNRIVEIISN